MITELGRTRLDTTRQRARRIIAIGLGLVGGIIAAWFGAAIACWVTGHGWHYPHIHTRPLFTQGTGGLLGLSPTGEPTQPGLPQIPVTMTWPVPVWAALPAGVPLWILWLRATTWPVLRGLRLQIRHLGLASLSSIRRSLGARAARRSGKFTLPETPWWQRWLRDTTAFGYSIGTPLQPKSWKSLWVNWEQRVRIVARPGWGKTERLLIPIIRTLPGPAIVASTEPAIFERTVTARRYRRLRLRWRWLDWLLRRWLPIREYPIAVVDFSPPESPFAAGYPSALFNAIDGCEDYAVAARRAVALVSGAETDTNSQRGGDNDQFFRDASSAVLAAWLHAAALGRFEINDMREWLRDTQDPRPRRVLREDPRADPAAFEAVTKHLDPRAERTSSGVERFLTIAMESLTSHDGQRLSGRRFDANGRPITGGFDIADFIQRGGTLYLLAHPSRIDRARPALSMFANETFFAAENVALRCRSKRLPLPFLGVIDEMRYGVTVSHMPYVASAQRKYNISYIYTVQSSTQEEAVYGDDAQALRDAAGISIIGGIDIASAKETSDRAGQAPVVNPTRGMLSNESTQLQDVFTIGDQQKLADGESVIIARGLAPFKAYTRSFRQNWLQRRRILHEGNAIATEVAAAAQRHQVDHDPDSMPNHTRSNTH